MRICKTSQRQFDLRNSFPYVGIHHSREANRLGDLKTA